MRYSDIQTFVAEGLAAKGYSGSQMPLFDPGPFTIARLQNKTPGSMVFLVVGNGLGLAMEGILDRPFVVVRVLGPQNDYDSAERLAYDVDDVLLSVGGNTLVGTAKTLFITRTGGSPQLVDFDPGDRYHFQQTYITEGVR